jgi:peptidoglycan/LPS O-acetylase OafA/YrhL
LILFVVALLLSTLWFSVTSHFAQIGIGTLLAASPRTREITRAISNGWVLCAAAAFLILRPVLSPLAEVYNVSGVFVPPLTAIVFFGTISDRGPFVFLVQHRCLQRIGLISYSLYLWQQLGTAPNAWNGTMTGAESLYRYMPFLFVSFIIPAVVSYFLLERPFIRFGHRVSRLIWRLSEPHEIARKQSLESILPPAGGVSKESVSKG